MRCPVCTALDDKVVDSRASDDGLVVRRRRECLVCNRRFTTYERIEEVALVVVKRSGERRAFERRKVVEGMAAAAKNRPITAAQLDQVAADVEDGLRLSGSEVATHQIGRAVLERLRLLDDVAYLRFASVYKGFADATDFEREVGLLAKDTEPKRS